MAVTAAFHRVLLNKINLNIRIGQSTVRTVPHFYHYKAVVQGALNGVAFEKRFILLDQLDRVRVVRLECTAEYGL